MSSLKPDNPSFALAGDLLAHARYQFHTLAQGRRVAEAVAQLCPVPSAQLPGLMELIANAVEHGNLEIDYDTKRQLLQAGKWLEEIERRGNLPQYSDRVVMVSYERTPLEVVVTIADQGKGFDHAQYMKGMPEDVTRPHGRGIALAHKMYFDELEYLGNGSSVRVRARWPRERASLVEPQVSSNRPLGERTSLELHANATTTAEAAKRSVVLIADDEPVTRVLLMGALRNHFEVVCAFDGQDALEKYQTHRPDLMLVDVQMPRLTGGEVCERIRNHETDERMPILLMSSQDGEDFVLEGLARGADDFIVKPVNQRVLLQKIHAQLAHKSTRDVLTLQRERLLQLQSSTAREYFVAQAVLRNILGRAELDHSSIEYSMTGMGAFEGDVALVAKLPSAGLRFMVSDVAGHGLPAALGTIPLSLLFYSTTRRGIPLGVSMTEINRELCGVLPVGLFAASAAFEVSQDARTLRVWNGGIPDLILRRRDNRELTRFGSRNLPIGIAAQDAMVVEEVQVQPGDIVFAMSDGVIEARNVEGQLFGMERVLETLAAARPLAGLFQDLRRAIAQHCQGQQHDDVTLLAHTIGA